jgi:hypothetical protein
MRLSPVMFEQGRGYILGGMFTGPIWIKAMCLLESIGGPMECYRNGGIGPGGRVSLVSGHARLVSIKKPAATSEQRLAHLQRSIEEKTSYKHFSSPQRVGQPLTGRNSAAAGRRIDTKNPLVRLSTHSHNRQSTSGQEVR